MSLFAFTQRDRLPGPIQDELDALYARLQKSPAGDGILDPAHGGTGLSSYVRGDLIVATAEDVLGTIAAAEDGLVLTSQGPGELPLYELPRAAPLDTYVQYNQSGVFGADAGFVRDYTVRTVTLRGLSNQGGITLNPFQDDYSDLTLGMVINASGDYVPTASGASYLWNSGEGFLAGLELLWNETPGVASSLVDAVGMRVAGPNASGGPAVHAYQRGGLGTGAVPGMALRADANSDGAGAASSLVLQTRSEVDRAVWFDAMGLPRWGDAQPTEDDSVDDESGELFGDVRGPAGGSTDQHVAVFDGITGKLLADGGMTIAEILASGASTSYYEPLTDGDVDQTELIFADGDVIMVEVFP